MVYLLNRYYRLISSSYSFHRNTRSCCLQCIESTQPSIVPMHRPCSCLLESSILRIPCCRIVSPHDSIWTCYILLFFLALLVNLGVFFVEDSSCSLSQICPPMSPDKSLCWSNCSQISWLFSTTATVYAKSEILIKSNMFCSCSWQPTIEYDGNHTTLTHTCQWSSVSSSFSIHHLNGKLWDSSSWSGHPWLCIIIHSRPHQPIRPVF